MFRRSLRLTRVSFDVMRSTPSLIIPPIIAIVSSLILVLTASGVFFLRAGRGSSVDPGSYSVIEYVMFSLILLVTSTVTLLCNATVVAAANARLRGEPATLSQSFNVAFSRFPQILGWGVITVAVGMILRAIEERAGFLGAIISWIGSVAWAVITYFVLPVLVIEKVGPIEAIKRSSKIVRTRWGEVVAFEVGIGLVAFLCLLPIIAIAVALGLLVHPVAGIVMGAGAFAFLMAVTTALTAVYQTALYQYSVWGWVPHPFTEGDFVGVATYKRRGLFGSRMDRRGAASLASMIPSPTGQPSWQQPQPLPPPMVQQPYASWPHGHAGYAPPQPNLLYNRGDSGEQAQSN